MKLNRTFTIIWILIVAVGVAWEIFALTRPGKGDTLSEQVWALLSLNVLGWFIGAGILAWIVIHFLGYGRVDDWIRSLPKRRRKL